ncbi:MAG: tyrosine-type recombinase/integrase [Lachnospiraceae bacterium]|nr:tyrosine-type recombinase/integrase [Lachnospiraceae bacterium]
MKIKAKDPRLLSLMGEFMRVYLPCVRNRDEDTVASYRHSINLFVTFLEAEHKITIKTMQTSDFNQKNIVRFMSWLKSDRNNVAPTINHRLSDIRGFCRYLYKKNAIALDDYEEICEINNTDDDRVIDFTWLSIDDVCMILKSVDGEADVHFYGKGRKHRIIPLSKEIWRQFERYCEKYHTDKVPDNLMFYSYRNGRKNKMSSDNVSRILDGCETRVKKDTPELLHLHSHLFRRTRAMHLYQAGVPLPTISEWLGHSNIETTRFYAKVTEEMKREALHKLSDSDSSVFKDDVAFKYANDEDTIKRLCGLK